MHLWQALWHRLRHGNPVTLEDIFADLIASGEIGTHNPEMITQTVREDRANQ